MTGDELLEKWSNANGAYHFESNTKNLAKLVEALGYERDAFGCSIDHFLRDNPGAQEAIITWVAEQLDHSHDWRKAIEAQVTNFGCADCGEESARTGHMGCSNPQDHSDAGIDDPMETER